MAIIKSLSLHKYDYVLKDMNSEEFELKGGIYSISHYDKEGRTISEKKLDSAGGISEHYEYQYNDEGAIISERSYDEDGELIDNMEFEFDETGKIRYGYKIYLDGSRDTISYRYDNAGNLIEKEVRTDEDEVELLEKFSYEGNNEILHESRDEGGECIYKKETIWNDKGNVLETTTWMAETEESARIVNQYDENDELSSVVSYDGSDQIVFKLEYLRDDSGQVIEVREESDERTALTFIKYDEHGNAVTQEERNKHGEINSMTERKYDAEGNVTESEAIIDHHGMGMNQHYILKYEYEMYDE